jgi:O-antigen/teichoic acid export membrane protein
LAVLGSATFTLYMANNIENSISDKIFWSISIVTVICALCRFGYDTRAYKELVIILKKGDKEEISNYLYSSLLGQMAITFLVSIILYIVMNLLNIELGYFYFSLVFYSGCYICSVFIRMLINNYTGLFLETFPIYASSVSLLFIWAFLGETVDFEFISIIFFSSSAFAFLLSLSVVMVKIKVLSFDKNIWRGYISHAGFVPFLIFLYSQSPIIVGGYIVKDGLSDVVVALKLASLSTIGLMAISSYIQPKMSLSLASKNYTELYKIYKFSIFTSLSVFLAYAFFLFIFSEEILGLLGVYSTNVYINLIILMIGYFANVVVGGTGEFLLMTNKSKIYFWATFFTCIIAFMFSIIFSDVYGSLGISLTISLSLIIQNMMTGIFVFSNFKKLRNKYNLIPLSE